MFKLESEIPDERTNYFTGTQFVTWEFTDNSIIVFWGNDLRRIYHKMEINRFANVYNELKVPLNRVDKDSPNIDVDYYTNEITALLNKWSTGRAKIPNIEVQTDNVQNYNDLYRHLWRLNPNDIIENCPINNIDLIMEWHGRMLEKKIESISISSMKMTDGDRAIIKKDFASEMAQYANNKISQSREWYAHIYGNDGGNSLTRYPIKELKKYINWLEEILITPKQYFAKEDIVQEAIVIDEIKKTNSKRLKEWVLKHGIQTIPKVQPLSDIGKAAFMELLTAYNKPKLIAMLETVGFIEHLRKEYYPIQNDLYENLCRALYPKEELYDHLIKSKARTIKGHILVLNPASKEDRDRYTSHEYLKDVQQEFENLK